MKTKISKTLTLGQFTIGGIHDVYHLAESVVDNNMALCYQVVNRCLGRSGTDGLPESILVTASVKPLKIKGTRKLLVNFGLNTFDMNVWKFATSKGFPGLLSSGMYRKANTILRKLLEDNNILPSDGLRPIWVNVKVLKA